MKRSLVFVWSMFLFSGITVFSSASFGSYINVIDEGGYAEAFVSTEIGSNTVTDYSLQKDNNAYAILHPVPGSYVEGVARFTSSYDDNNVTIDVGVGFKKSFSPEGAPNEYLVNIYADSHINFIIESDYGQTGDVVEASVGLYSWAEALGTYSNLWNDIEVEIHLLEADTHEMIFDTTFIRLGGHSSEEIMLQPLLQYGQEYEAYVYATVWSNEDFTEVANPADFYYGTLDVASLELSIELGIETPPDVDPVPEPSTILLLGSGLLGLGWYGRKRKKS